MMLYLYITDNPYIIDLCNRVLYIENLLYRLYWSYPVTHHLSNIGRSFSTFHSLMASIAFTAA